MHYENNEARFRFRNDEREGLVAWSSHSPNFTSLYYFLQGYIKGIIKGILNLQQLMIIWSLELLQHLKIFHRRYWEESKS